MNTLFAALRAMIDRHGLQAVLAATAAVLEEVADREIAGNTSGLKFRWNNNSRGTISPEALADIAEEILDISA